MQSTAQGSGNAQSSTPQRPSTVEEQLDLQLQQVQGQQPLASSAGNELAMAQHRAEPAEAAAHSAVLSQAVQDAVNRLIAANWDIGIAVATQALHRLSITMALQILESVTTTAPVDINAWVRERAMAALCNQPPSNTQPQGAVVPEGAPLWQEARASIAKAPQVPLSKAFEDSATGGWRLVSARQLIVALWDDKTDG